MAMWKDKKPWETDYGKKSKFKKPSVPKFNKRLSLFLLLIITVFILSYLTYTRGNYIQVLEENRTELENHLSDCFNQTQSLTVDLNECQECLEGNETSLAICQDERKTLSSSLSNCENNLNSCEGDISGWKSDYQTCIKDLSNCEDFLDSQEEDLDGCESDLDDIQDDYNAMKNNYAKDYCCLLQETDPTITHYTTSDTKVSCGNSGTQLNC